MTHPPIVALHGFLGTNKDFKSLALPQIIAPPLHAFACSDFSSWAARFNRALPKKSVLMGYSMGGRLALHCLINHPNQFAAAIILAAHPGLRSHKEREVRYAHDHAWSTKFHTTPWPELMTAWNQQQTLSSSPIIVRHEHDFSRAWLAHCLRHFSLGKQADLSTAINQLSVPILWLSPQDESQRVKDLSFRHPLSEMIMIKEGGHRFMFASPNLVSDTIRNFLAKVKQASA